jgi:hypothetical protein
MKPVSLRQQTQPVTRAKALNCALLNQLAAPGLGSLMAHRWIAGLGQLLLALTGFGLITAWFCLLVLQFIQALTEAGQPPSGHPVTRLAFSGAAMFAVSWFWALITSMSLMREARENEKATVPPPIPPQA